MLNIWTQRSGYSFGTIQESTAQSIPLPVTYDNIVADSSAVTYRVISGGLPPGLRILGDSIVGTAFEVPRITDFSFCIRATYNEQISDRTFTITVDGQDDPEFLTSTGLLPVGSNNAYFVLDSSFVDFQINVIDLDTASGQTLKYFISSGDGDLPPGLTLTEDGRISGFIDPIPVIPIEAGDGSYSSELYDQFGYDYGSRPDNGYDSYIYDSVFFDFFLPVKSPRKLNRNYEFIISVSDSDVVAKRQFKIYVVGDDFLRADNTLASARNAVFTVDGTYLRAPIWITAADLGIHRANNYVTIFLDTYDAQVLGPVIYSLDVTNPDGSASLLPPDMQFDASNGEIFGVVPYQPAVTKTYNFTVTATRFGEDLETITQRIDV